MCFWGELQLLVGLWMVPVSLTPRACPATPQEDMEDTNSSPESSLAWLPRCRGSECCPLGARGLNLEAEEGVRSHRFSLKDGEKSGGITLDPHKKGSPGGL